MRTTLFAFIVATMLVAPVSDLRAQDARTSMQAVLARLVPDKRLPDDLTLTGQLTDASGTQPFRMIVKGKDQVRYEIGTGPAMVVTTRSKGTGSRTAGGKIEILQQYSAVERPALLPFLDLLAEADTPTLQATDRGAFAIGSLTTRRFTLKLPDPAPRTRMFGRALDEETDFYIDPVSLLVARSERWVMAENSMNVRFRVIDEFSDYRSVQGLAVPFRIVETVNVPTRPQFRSVYVIANAIVNAGIADTVFTGEEPRR